MIPNSDKIISDIISLLCERDPDADEIYLKSNLDKPLETIYKINSQIGVDIASALADQYKLPELPPTKLKNRNYYISIGGLADLVNLMTRASKF